MRFTIEVLAGRQLPRVQVCSWWGHFTEVRPMGGASCPPPVPGPSVVEPTRQSKGHRGYYNQRVEGLTPAGKVSLAARGKRPSAGWPESDRARASEELEGACRHREQTSVESFKSTWRAVRFLSVRGAHVGRRPVASVLEGI